MLKIQIKLLRECELLDKKKKLSIGGKKVEGMICPHMNLIELNKANINKMMKNKKTILNNYNLNSKCHKKLKMKVILIKKNYLFFF